MKLYISENIDKAIEGFTLVPIIYGEVDLSNIPNNAASTIVCIDGLDNISQEKIETFINTVCSKLRLNGTVYFGGLDPYAVSRGLLSGNIDLKEYNILACKKHGLYSSKYIIDLLKQNNITIESAVYRGYFYEISANRQHSKN